MLNISIFLLGGVFVTALLSAGISRLALKLTKRKRLSILAGGLLLPTLFIIELGYWLHTMQVDDSPPGPVIAGSLVAVAIFTPIGLIASILAIRATSGER